MTIQEEIKNIKKEGIPFPESKINNKTPKIDFDDLSTKELQQLLDFVV